MRGEDDGTVVLPQARVASHTAVGVRAVLVVDVTPATRMAGGRWRRSETCVDAGYSQVIGFVGSCRTSDVFGWLFLPIGLVLAAAAPQN